MKNTPFWKIRHFSICLKITDRRQEKIHAFKNHTHAKMKVCFLLVQPKANLCELWLHKHKWISWWAALPKPYTIVLTCQASFSQFKYLSRGLWGCYSFFILPTYSIVTFYWSAVFGFDIWEHFEIFFLFSLFSTGLIWLVFEWDQIRFYFLSWNNHDWVDLEHSVTLVEYTAVIMCVACCSEVV